MSPFSIRLLTSGASLVLAATTMPAFAQEAPVIQRLVRTATVKVLKTVAGEIICAWLHIAKHYSVDIRVGQKVGWISGRPLRG